MNDLATFLRRSESPNPLLTSGASATERLAAPQLLAVNEALEKFTALDPRKAELVKLRYFVGMGFDEASTALGIAVPTAKQWWAYVRAWLTAELRNGALR